MSKKKSKNTRSRPVSAAAAAAPNVSCAPRLAWESVEADFFARASDLYQVNPVENFADLDTDSRRRKR